MGLDYHLDPILIPPSERHHYRFRIHRLFDKSQQRLFQLRVGMEGERDFELVPVHRTAFAEHLDLEPAHATMAGANLELTNLLHWLDTRRRVRPRLELTRRARRTEAQ